MSTGSIQPKHDSYLERVGRGPNESHAPTVALEWFPWIASGEFRDESERFLTLTNPSNGEELCRVALCDRSAVDKAVDSAREALPGWANMPSTQRGRRLVDVALRLREAEEEFAVVETLNTGKPLREARQDVQKSAEAFEFYGGLADKVFGSTIPVSPAFLNYTVREPIGVTAHIAPWNYPLRLAVRSVAPALAAGNTVVLKPAEGTPLTVLLLGRLLSEAGFPPGVLNVLPGTGPEAGAALVEHPSVNHVSFTGSVETGIEIMRSAARNVTPVTLELGGKSPNIVFADADLDLAVQGAIKAIFVNAGQVCCAGSRLLLDDSIHDRFLERLISSAQAIRIGPGMEDPDMGPLISEEHRKRVLDYIDVGLTEGAKVVCGGGVPKDANCARGYFVEPTLLAGVPHAARVAQEEIFGPVLTIFRFSSEDEAVRLANDTPYGLVAGVWTSNLARAHRVSALIQAGQVYVNDFFSGSVSSPFGGYKRSGFGRERGVEALEHYTQVKSVCVRLEH